MNLVHHLQWHSSLSAEAFYTELENSVEPVERFRLISKVSGAGIVTRVLQGPSTERPFWGKVNIDGIRIVQNLPSINVTPFQPIVEIKVEQQDLENQDSGTQISVDLKPHSQATMFAVLENLVAVLCFTAGLVSIQQNPVGGLGLLMGFALVLFPRWRARRSFANEIDRCIVALQELPCQWETSEASSPGS